MKYPDAYRNCQLHNKGQGFRYEYQNMMAPQLSGIPMN